MIQDPIRRISIAYATLEPGGVLIDVEAMTTDIIAVCKMGGHGLEELLQAIAEAWPHVEADLALPAKEIN